MTPLKPSITPQQSAKKAGLVYTSDLKPGIQRKKAGKSFKYFSPKGKPITDEKTLKRIHSLVIPPAWTDVWICTQANGHLQATGRDSRNRKQYRYHPDWRAIRDETKYHKMLKFGQALPKIRRHLQKDLNLPGMPQEKILATVIRVMEKTLIRVGNEEYAKENHSYGLTTMMEKHVEIRGATVKFHFKGKSGVIHDIELHDKRLAKIIKNCEELPGHDLFEYRDEHGKVRTVGSENVNEYLQAISGEHFSAKDFRTWYGTVLAAEELQSFDPFKSQNQAKKNVIEAVEKVAQRLGNTRSVCRKCYIHPGVIECYMQETLSVKLQPKEASKGLTAEEGAVMAFLNQAEG